jgi:hypothetical protein
MSGGVIAVAGESFSRETWVKLDCGVFLATRWVPFFGSDCGKAGARGFRSWVTAFVSWRKRRFRESDMRSTEMR